MQQFKLPPLPRSRTTQAALVTLLYSVLTLFAVHAPISPDAPFVTLFGSQELARQAVTGFVRWLFWPLIGILVLTAARSCYEFAARRRRGS